MIDAATIGELRSLARQVILNGRCYVRRRTDPTEAQRKAGEREGSHNYVLEACQVEYAAEFPRQVRDEFPGGQAGTQTIYLDLDTVAVKGSRVLWPAPIDDTPLGTVYAGSPPLSPRTREYLLDEFLPADEPQVHTIARLVLPERGGRGV